MDFNKGERVRLIDNPGRIGIITGHTMLQADRTLYQIQFPNKYQYFAYDQIEYAPPISEDPFDLFKDKRFGKLENLSQILNHIRLNGKLIDHIYSLETTNTDFYAFQFKPVLKILESSSNGILIADEVGLGKTIEAGLIWTELKSRFDYKRLFVLCPSMLREKWRLELKNRFGIKAEICNAKEALEIIKESMNDNNSEFAIISSIEGLRPNKGWDDLDFNEDNVSAKNILANILKENENENKIIDLLIIDEAHYLRNFHTQNAKIGRLLRAVSDYIVLLTATPIHLKNEDLFNLVRLVDEDIFANQHDFNTVLMANEPLVKMRDRLLTPKMSLVEYNKLLSDILQNPVLKNLKQIQWLGGLNPSQENIYDIKYRNYLAYKLDLINFLGNIISRNRKRDVIKNHVIRDANAISIPLMDISREFYYTITTKIKKYCKKYHGFESFLLVTPQRQMSSSMPAALKYWQEKDLSNYDIIEEELFEDIGFIKDDKDKEEEIKPLLRELIKISQDFDFQTLVQNDLKLKNLLRIITELIDKNKGEKIIVFSYFRATIDYLSEQLDKNGIKNIILKGGGNVDKETIISKFKNNYNINVLISSEIGSEGIDLQFCRIIVNYDLPWNPMRVEQRIGRIDRIGQNADKIMIYNFFYEKTIDSRIYYKLYVRLKIFERTIGLPEAILGEKIQNLTNEILITDLTPQQEEERINQTAHAIENRIMQEEQLEEQAVNLLAYGDYIINKVSAARELKKWISEEDILNYIKYYILQNYTGSQFEKINNGENYEYFINLSNQAKHDLENYSKNQKHPIHTALYANDNRAIGCKISCKIAQGKNIKKYEIINQIHPLVRFVSYNIDKKANSVFYPAICSRLKIENAPKDMNKGEYLFVIQKWTIQGIQNKEKLFYFSVKVDNTNIELSEEVSETLILNAIKYGEEWYNPFESLDWDRISDIINNKCLFNANNRFTEFRREYELSNTDRVSFQLNSLDKHLTNQEDKLFEIRQKHSLNNRNSLVMATNGRIQKLRSRVERQKMDINNRANIIAQKDDLSVGLILIY